MLRFGFAGFTVFSAVGLANAAIFAGPYEVPITAATGTGDSTAVLVLDFGPQSYAFTYSWDTGSPTGWDMLTAFDEANILSVDATYNDEFDAYYVNTITYGDAGMGGGGWPGDWVVYFASEDGLTWSSSDLGPNLRPLTDGAWDAWSRQTTDTWPAANFPTTPGVPEPSALALVTSLGLFAAWRRARI